MRPQAQYVKMCVSANAKRMNVKNVALSPGYPPSTAKIPSHKPIIKPSLHLNNRSRCTTPPTPLIPRMMLPTPSPTYRPHRPQLPSPS